MSDDIKPSIVGALLKCFVEFPLLLNIAVVSVHDYPLSDAPYQRYQVLQPEKRTPSAS